MRRLLIGSTCVALLLAANLASADTITIADAGTFDNFDHFTDPHPTNGMIEVTGTIVPFDTSLGTLTAVTLRIGGMYEAGLNLTVTDPGIYFGHLRPFETFGVVGGPELWGEPFECCRAYGAGHYEVGTDGVVLHATTGQPVSSSHAPFVVPFGDGNGSNGRLITLTDNLDPFLTAGTLFVGTRFYVMSVWFPDGSRHDFPAGSSGGQFGVWRDITYTYTPVPEPSTALLVGIGLALVSAVRSWRIS